MKKGDAEIIKSNNLQVTNELIGQTIFADTIKTNNLFMEKIAALNMNVAKALTVKDIVVNGIGTFNTSLTINGIGVNGAALTVNHGEIVANEGIVSHTRNNRFQCMQIMGSGVDNDVCFKVNRKVDSLFQGNAQESNLLQTKIGKTTSLEWFRNMGNPNRQPKAMIHTPQSLRR